MMLLNLDKLDLKNEEVRNALKKFYLDISPNEPIEWFKEETGLEKWVLYRKDQYEIDTDLFGRKFLHFCGNLDSIIEVPLGLSSCYYMFSDSVTGTHVNLAMFRDQKVIDTRNMFFNNYNVMSIDLSLLNLNYLQCSDFMFAEALDLRSIKFPQNLTQFPYSTGLFMGCSRLKNIDTNNYNLFKDFI